MSLIGRVVAITGAAGMGLGDDRKPGQGIGAAMSRLFVAAGAQVIAIDVHEEGLRALKQELPDITTVHADISTTEGVATVCNSFDGGIDVLCNNAAISDGLANVIEIPKEQWERVIRVNLTAPFLLTQRVIPMMIAKHQGVITNTASIAGIRGGRGGVAYTSSKFALVGLTQNVAAAFGAQGIRCNAICPGLTGHVDPVEDRPGLSAAALAIVTRDRDRPPSCAPEMVAELAVFLAREEAVRINGAIIPIDGGWAAY